VTAVPVGADAGELDDTSTDATTSFSEDSDSELSATLGACGTCTEEDSVAIFSGKKKTAATPINRVMTINAGGFVNIARTERPALSPEV
jgi:hypothetical protein